MKRLSVICPNLTSLTLDPIEDFVWKRLPCGSVEDKEETGEEEEDLGRIVGVEEEEKEGELPVVSRTPNCGDCDADEVTHSIGICSGTEEEGGGEVGGEEHPADATEAMGDDDDDVSFPRITSLKLVSVFTHPFQLHPEFGQASIWTPSELSRMLKSFPNLRHLEIDDGVRDVPNDLSENMVSNLESLKIAKVRPSSDKPFVHLKEWRTSLPGQWSNCVMPSLESLSYMSGARIDLGDALKAFPALRSLKSRPLVVVSLGAPNILLTRIDAVFEYSHWLDILSFMSFCPFLETVNVGNCGAFSRTQLRKRSPMLENCTRLSEVAFAGIQEEIQYGLALYILQHCPTLSVLGLQALSYSRVDDMPLLPAIPQSPWKASGLVLFLDAFRVQDAVRLLEVRPGVSDLRLTSPLQVYHQEGVLPRIRPVPVPLPALPSLKNLVFLGTSGPFLSRLMRSSPALEAVSFDARSWKRFWSSPNLRLFRTLRSVEVAFFAISWKRFVPWFNSLEQCASLRLRGVSFEQYDRRGGRLLERHSLKSLSFDSGCLSGWHLASILSRLPHLRSASFVSTSFLGSCVSALSSLDARPPLQRIKLQSCRFSRGRGPTERWALLSAFRSTLESVHLFPQEKPIHWSTHPLFDKIRDSVFPHVTDLMIYGRYLSSQIDLDFVRERFPAVHPCHFDAFQRHFYEHDRYADDWWYYVPPVENFRGFDPKTELGAEYVRIEVRTARGEENRVRAGVWKDRGRQRRKRGRPMGRKQDRLTRNRNRVFCRKEKKWARKKRGIQSEGI